MKEFSEGEIDNALIDRALEQFGDMLKNRLALARQYRADLSIGSDNPITPGVFKAADDLVAVTFEQVCLAAKWLPVKPFDDEKSALEYAKLQYVRFGILQPPLGRD